MKWDSLGLRPTLFVDNFTGHVSSPEVQSSCDAANVELRKLSKNSTDLTHPVDSFIIAKIKYSWTKRWYAYKSEMIRKGEWMKGTAASGGRLKNPGKKFFLRLEADSVREINCMADKDGVSYALKSMIRAGMSLNRNGRWEEGHL